MENEALEKKERKKPKLIARLYRRVVHLPYVPIKVKLFRYSIYIPEVKKSKLVMMVTLK